MLLDLRQCSGSLRPGTVMRARVDYGCRIYEDLRGPKRSAHELTRDKNARMVRIRVGVDNLSSPHSRSEAAIGFPSICLLHC